MRNYIQGWEISNCREWESVSGTVPIENEKLYVRNYNRGWEISNCREWESVCGTVPMENEKLHVRNNNQGVGNKYLQGVGVVLWICSHGKRVTEGEKLEWGG